MGDELTNKEILKALNEIDKNFQQEVYASDRRIAKAQVAKLKDREKVGYDEGLLQGYKVGKVDGIREAIEWARQYIVVGGYYDKNQTLTHLIVIPKTALQAFKKSKGIDD